MNTFKRQEIGRIFDCLSILFGGLFEIGDEESELLDNVPMRLRKKVAYKRAVKDLSRLSHACILLLKVMKELEMLSLEDKSNV